MLRNFFKVAVRNLWKQKGYSALNIFGLALGMACSLLILLWIRDEKSVDAYHVNRDRLYSIYERQYYDGKISSGFYTPGILSDQMKKDLPEVEMATGFTWEVENTFQVGDKILKEKGRYAGADLFRMFSYPLLQGSPSTALATPASMAISRKMAVDFFGSPGAAIGQSIRFENRKEFKITGVFGNIPQNSSARFDFVINWTAFLDDNSWAKDWGNNGPMTFLLLRKDADPAAFTRKITHYLDAYNKEQSKTFRIQLGMQRLDQSYLYSHFNENGQIDGGRIEYVRLFSIVAIFILLIACINFMNLTTARSVKRSKEIGIRKVVGAVRSALIRQFIGEAIFISCLSVVLALGMVLLLLPAFNSMTEKSISFPFADGVFWLSLGGLALATGVVSGSYPALFLSAFQPIRVLKGAPGPRPRASVSKQFGRWSLKFTAGAAWFRKGLVVFQFVLSIALIIGTIVISGQVDYIQSVNLGFDRDDLVYLPLEGDMPDKYKTFKEQALQMPGVTGVTKVSNEPTDIENGTSGVDWDGKDPNNTIMFTQISVGYDFVKTMRLQLAEGREYSPEYGTDTAGYMLNEEAARRIGYKDPIGRRLTFWQKKGKIIGVVKNFHFASLHDPIQPLIIRYGEDGKDNNYGSILVRIKGGEMRQTLDGLQQLSHQLNPRFPFSYRFADEQYRNLYKSEALIHRLSNCFAALAICICCLGLLGLAMFTAEQRTKEFGIRKVLGAGSGTLFSLLSRDFLALVLIAFVVATPLAWWAMSEWLQNYAYHVSLAWWVFALAGIIALAIALLTVSFQAFRVAVANPVSSLRSE